MSKCSFDFTDSSETIIQCQIHKDTKPFEKLVLRPDAKEEVLRIKVEAGEWGGRVLPSLQKEDKPLRTVSKDQRQTKDSEPRQSFSILTEPQAQLPATVKKVDPEEVIEWKTTFGDRVQLTVQMFKTLLCPQASNDEAMYFLQWCHHNGIDPFQREATFSIMKEREKDTEGKPVEPANWIRRPTIMVARDAWVKRAHESNVLASYEYGIIVETSLKNIQTAIVGGFGDDYCIPEQVKESLLNAALGGKQATPTGLPDRLRVKKRGQFLNEGETLKGGWFLPERTDGKVCRPFEINLEGWQGPSHFWKGDNNKAPFMMAGAALRNGIRHEIPRLASLIAQPSLEDIDPASAADYELQIEHTPIDALIRRLHAIGKEVAPPVGPLLHTELHTLSVATFDHKGIAELDVNELTIFIGMVNRAANGDEEMLRLITEDLALGGNNGSTRETQGTATDSVNRGSQDGTIVDIEFERPADLA